MDKLTSADTAESDWVHNNTPEVRAPWSAVVPNRALNRNTHVKQVDAHTIRRLGRVFVSGTMQARIFALLFSFYLMPVGTPRQEEAPRTADRFYLSIIDHRLALL